MPNYKVKYKVDNSTSSTTLNLYGGTESQAIAELKRRSSVPKDKNVIILSIEKG